MICFVILTEESSSDQSEDGNSSYSEEYNSDFEEFSSGKEDFLP